MKLNRKHPVVRVLSYACAAALAVSLSLVPARANNVDFGVRGGAYSEDSDPFLGAEVLFQVGSPHWYGNPNVEHAFADRGDLTTVSFDFHYDFHQTREYTVWAGAGPTVLFRDNSGTGNSDTSDPGVNLVLGVGALKGDARPYGQMKVIVADDSAAVLGVGVRF
jgi:hypothetical protein